MTITAKFPGTCRKCGQPFGAGSQINWVKGEGSEHVTCPTAKPKTVKPAASCPAATKTEPAPAGVVKLFTNRHKEGGPEVGYTFRSREGQILTVIHVFRRWISQNEVDDQDDFRNSGDPFYEFRATCREATTEEAAAITTREQVKAAKAAAQGRLEVIARQIRKADNHVTDYAAQFATVEGAESVSVKLNTITTLSVGGNGIWVYESAYDDSHSWRIDYDAALADEIRKLATVLC